MNWSYEGEEVLEIPHGMKAFVYLLVFEDGTKYIGKKNVYSTRRVTVPGKTRKSIVVTESNWKVYNSSSEFVKSKLKHGDKLVAREIIRWCESTSESTYFEAHEQFKNHVLLDATYLNKWISFKAYRPKEPWTTQ
jgi:hypothetical protein